jgi:hypothetical protein
MSGEARTAVGAWHAKPALPHGEAQGIALPRGRVRDLCPQ